MALGQAAGPAFAAGTVSITVIEIGDNAIILAIPGAMEGGLDAARCWLSLAVAFVLADPVSLGLIRRGRGHAVVYRHHGPTLHGH